eukprot:TRINITY_DN8447_c0_g1_i1.p1 TRINITY_DN8447_c0_g1~~TRINITY_DN8447_c0_g1_i1.p1  ORF type:complete len:493 (+),score=75.83 TRINITY_DN8447_c0_g1_i1:292-1770(+)
MEQKTRRKKKFYITQCSSYTAFEKHFDVFVSADVPLQNTGEDYVSVDGESSSSKMMLVRSPRSPSNSNKGKMSPEVTERLLMPSPMQRRLQQGTPAASRGISLGPLRSRRKLHSVAESPLVSQSSAALSEYRPLLDRPSENLELPKMKKSDKYRVLVSVLRENVRVKEKMEKIIVESKQRELEERKVSPEKPVMFNRLTDALKKHLEDQISASPSRPRSLTKQQTFAHKSQRSSFSNSFVQDESNRGRSRRRFAGIELEAIPREKKAVDEFQRELNEFHSYHRNSFVSAQRLNQVLFHDPKALQILIDEEGRARREIDGNIRTLARRSVIAAKGYGAKHFGVVTVAPGKSFTMEELESVKQRLRDYNTEIRVKNLKQTAENIVQTSSHVLERGMRLGKLINPFHYLPDVGRDDLLEIKDLGGWKHHEDVINREGSLIYENIDRALKSTYEQVNSKYSFYKRILQGTKDPTPREGGLWHKPKRAPFNLSLIHI